MYAVVVFNPKGKSTCIRSKWHCFQGRKGSSVRGCDTVYTVKKQYLNLLFLVEIVSSGPKIPEYFHQKFNSTKDKKKTRKMPNNVTLLRSLYLPLSTTFCLHVSLEQNIKFVHEFCLWNIIPSENLCIKYFCQKK